MFPSPSNRNGLLQNWKSCPFTLSGVDCQRSPIQMYSDPCECRQPGDVRLLGGNDWSALFVPVDVAPLRVRSQGGFRRIDSGSTALSRRSSSSRRTRHSKSCCAGTTRTLRNPERESRCSRGLSRDSRPSVSRWKCRGSYRRVDKYPLPSSSTNNPRSPGLGSFTATFGA